MMTYSYQKTGLQDIQDNHDIIPFILLILSKLLCHRKT